MRVPRGRAMIIGVAALTGVAVIAVSRLAPTGGDADAARRGPVPTLTSAPALPSEPAPAPSPSAPSPGRTTTPPGRLHGGPAPPMSTSPPAAGDRLEAQPPADDPVLIEGALQNRDPLPPGVDEQVDFFFGGGPECWDPDVRRPSIGLQSKAIIPTEFLLCFLGFHNDQPLRITVTPPGGRPVTRTAPAEHLPREAGFFVPWPILPSDRAGKYRVAASQGDRTAARTFTLTRPATPRIWLNREPGEIDHSRDMDLYFAGFPPHGTVDFTIYREDRFFSTFRVPADALGGGHAVIRTGDDLPDACWGVTHPALAAPHLNVFCTSRRTSEAGGE